MSPLQSRKQLLIVESEINRAQLAGDMAVLTAGVRAFADHARSLSSIVSSVAALVTGLAAFRRGKPAAAGKPSWWQTLLKGSSLISTIWRAFCPPGCEQKRESQKA
jgi:hypothetical protein